MFRRLLVPVLCALLALVAVGCGQSDTRDEVTFTGAKKQVADVIGDLSDAAENDEPNRICDALVASSLAGDECQARIREALDDADTYVLDVRRVDITGATAKARVIAGSGDGERTTTISLVREGSTWKISALG